MTVPVRSLRHDDPFEDLFPLSTMVPSHYWRPLHYVSSARSQATSPGDQEMQLWRQVQMRMATCPSKIETVFRRTRRRRIHLMAVDDLPLVPNTSCDLEAYPVSQATLSWKNQGPELIQKA
jgi:hypothetical protein